MASVDIFNSVISVLDNVRTLKQLQIDQSVPDLKGITKRLYDFTKGQSCRKSDALPELITKDFDYEQIWQQLELQNKSELRHFSEKISKILHGINKFAVPVTSKKPESVQLEHDSLNQDNEDLSDKESEDENTKIKSILKKRKHDTRKKKKKSSIVDDKFFRLQELDEYLSKEERKEKQSGNVDRSDDESVDLFNDFSDEVEKEKYLKYIDFFDSPALTEESEEEGFDNENKGSDSGGEEKDYESSSKKVKFNLTYDSDETDSLENKVEHKKEDEEESNMETKSSLESRQERLRMRIQELEEEAIGEKPWQLKGEVSGLNRPQNSLLEEFVEFDVTTRPAPVITEKTTMKLEDIIKQRIKDKAWDDVEKKFKPVETPLEYKKMLVMDQEKSKKSLSQIYEDEYLKQKKTLYPDQEEKEEVMPELHREIRSKMRKLMSKLDALSNYHYTPKRIKPEIKIISNVPAVNMEEVAPVTTSDAAMLAPEEIKAKPRGDLVGKSERTITDKKRERRQKKSRQRGKQKAMKEKEKSKALKPGITKKYKKEKAALLKKLTKNRNITKSDETSQKVTKSSTAFFTQLQDQVKSHIKVKAGSVSKKKEKNSMSAIKLKL